jgi:hypothetical protein
VVVFRGAAPGFITPDSVFCAFDDGLDILVVDENFSTGLYIWQATRPYLGSPLPFRDAELIDQLFDGEEPFPAVV